MSAMAATPALSVSNAIYLRDFLDAKGIPYILCQVDICDGKKSIRKSTIPKGWMDWDYDVCCFYNNTRADPKCSVININLRSGGLVVVDIDGGNVEELVKKYRGQNITKSINRGLPHMWFERTDDDPYSTKIKVAGDDVDYLYTNVFESIDSVLTEYDGALDIFEWDIYLGEPVKNEIINHSNEEPADIENGHPLLDIIHIKYWTNYDTWRNLVWACIDHFGMKNGTQIAIRYSKQVNGVYEDGCVEKIAERFVEGKITWGTAHHYAKQSNPDAYYRLTARKIVNSDECLAHLFMSLRKEDLVSSRIGDYYFYYNNNWKRLDDKKGNDFLKRMIYLTLHPEIKNAQKSLLKQMDEVKKSHGVDSELFEKLRKQVQILQDIINRLDTTRGTNEIFNKVKQHMASLNENVLFDISDEQKFNLHFKNGVFELKTKTFRPRTQKDFITHKLDWNYSPVRDEAKINEILTALQKIQPDKIQLKFTISWLAQCLDGNTKREQFKMNIGASAGNGKSTEFSIHAKCFPIYTTFLSPKTFSVNYSTPHKQFYDFIYYPIRFAGIEEPEATKQDENLFKAFTSGKKFPIDVMYGNKIMIDLQAKLNICAQHDANMNIDQGILRRGLKQEYKSEFRDYYEDDFVNHKYKADLEWDEKFNDDEYKLAYFHLLLDHYDNFEIPAIFREAFKNSLEDYDEFSNIITDHFEKTNFGDADKIGKERVMEIFSLYKITSWRAILNKMKLAGFIYDKAIRCDGKRGAFCGIKEIAMSAPAEDEDH